MWATILAAADDLGDTISNMRPLLDLGLAGFFLTALFLEWIVPGRRCKKAEADLAALRERIEHDVFPTLIRATKVLEERQDTDLRVALNLERNKEMLETLEKRTR